MNVLFFHFIAQKRRYSLGVQTRLVAVKELGHGATNLLAQGKNYQTISQEAGISTATISRVSRCLNYGSGGYRTAIARLMGKEEP